MKVDEWMGFFKAHREKKLFSLSDLAVLSGEELSVLSVQLSRLVQAGMVRRVAHEWYENPFQVVSAEEVAMVLRMPSYVSLEYALSKHNVLSQQVVVITLVTTKLPYSYDIDGRIYEYHQIKKSLFWGFTERGGVSVAEAEKALLDLIYIRFARTGEMKKDAVMSLVDDMDLSMVDDKRLLKYCEVFDSRTKLVIFDIVKNFL